VRGRQVRQFSLRTLLLTVMGFAILCGLFTSGGLNATLAHTLLVLAFAIPGGSYGFDVGRSSRSVVVGTSVAAVVGTVSVCAAVLVLDLYTLLTWM
jgi:hypothetical protein